MSVTTSTIGRGFAPGSVVVVRDEEWLVTATEQTAGGLLIYGHGLSEMVRDATASFYDTLDDIEALDPAAATVVADERRGTAVRGSGWNPRIARRPCRSGIGRSPCPPGPLPMR